MSSLRIHPKQGNKLRTVIVLLAHLPVSSGLDASFSNNNSEGEEAEVVVKARGGLLHPSRWLTGQVELSLLLF